MLNKYSKNKFEHGSTLIELIFYISLFAVVSLLAIDAMLVMTKSFKETAIQSEFVQSGGIMERISREIRQASSISSISSTDLILNTTTTAGVSKTVEFLLSGSNIQFLENGTLVGNLNTPNIVVTGLTFTSITTTESKAVKVYLTLRSSNDRQNRVKEFYDTIVLRGSY
jgi:Tfp pilus assembly protein PilE